jgi:hypothetical protein
MSCLFDILSYFLKIDSFIIRQKICDYLEQNKPIIDGLDTKFVLELDGDNYVSAMRNTTRWGGANEILAACNIWKLQINVVMYNQKKVLDFLDQKMPDKVIPYDQFSASMVELYIAVGDQAAALKMASKIVKRDDQLLDYYLDGRYDSHERDVQIAIYEMNLVVSALKASKVSPAKYQELEAKFTKQMGRLQ